MTWSFISSDTFSSGATGTSSYVVPLPSYLQGDLAIITAYRDQDNGDWSTTSTGWARDISRRDNSGRDRSTAIFHKVMASNSEPDPAISYSNGASEEISWMIHVFRTSDGPLSTADVIADIQVSAGQNDPAPPVPSVTTTQANAAVICIALITHSDITNVIAPSGFTVRDEVSGSANIHRQQMLASDFSVAIGSVSIGDWQTQFSNGRGEYTSYALALRYQNSTSITSIDDGRVDDGDQNVVITGAGFKTLGASSKLEIGDSATYGSATLVEQTSIDSWSDTSITFDANLSAFSNGSLYAFVTNRDGTRSDGFMFFQGKPDYFSFVLDTEPDIYHRFNNSYADEQGTYPANGQNSTGTVGFVTTPITRSNTHAFQTGTPTSAIEMVDTAFTNVSVTHTRREIGGWIRFDRVFTTPTGIWKEGGGVNNLYIVVGFGNRILCNTADSSNGFKAQAFSDFKLAKDRDYHVLLRWEGTGGNNSLQCWIDGVLQSTAPVGTPIGNAVFATHGGDWVYGDPDSNLDTGGTDIEYVGGTNTLYSDWVTYSEYGGGASLTNTERRFNLFEMGAIADVTITSGTQSAMQTQLNLLSNSVRPDAPLCIRVEAQTGGSDLTLVANNISFDPRASIHVQWEGSGTLTWKNAGSSDASIASLSNSGTLNFVNFKDLTLTGLQNPSEVRLYEPGTTTEISGGVENVTTGTFTASLEQDSVDIRILSLEYQNIALKGVDTSVDSSIPIQQQVDRQYEND